MSAGEKPTMVLAQVVWDKPALVWRMQISENVFAVDDEGEPRGWQSYHEADREACRVNRPFYGRGWV